MVRERQVGNSDYFQSNLNVPDVNTLTSFACVWGAQAEECPYLADAADIFGLSWSCEGTKGRKYYRTYWEVKSVEMR